MTHYYFDLKNGMTERDHAGLEFSSDQDAIVRGKLLADQIGSQGTHRDHACHVSIIREDGHEVMRVKVGQYVELTSAARSKKFS